MKIFKHNLEAGKKAFKMLEEKSRACVVHATGTGKSYISRYLMEKYDHLRIGYFAPSDYILKQMKEMLEESGNDLENIQMMTYLSLANKTVRDENELKFDFIILDEFHRCGAEYWGKGVEKLLKLNCNAKVFGTTATPIRTLDNGRDMSDELFDGNIASILTISDAIEKNILPNPKYVVALYSYLEELKNLRKMVDMVTSNERKVLINEKVTKLIEKLENVKGLESILKENITDKSSKCIVFAKSIEHLETIKEELVEKLKGVNKKIHVYVVHSKNIEAENEFEEFKKDNSDALKLLLTVDMLNEGMHIPDVKVAILMRPTISFIVYNQQIGRVLETSTKHTPVILDLVNNFDDMTIVKSIKAENECYIQKRKNGSNKQDYNFPFEIIDEVREIKELFNKVYKDLYISKEEKVKLLIEFFEENKRMPKGNEEYKGVKIGVFFNCIKKGETKISNENMEILKRLGFIFDRKNVKELVHEKVILLVEFFEENGRPPKSSEEFKGVKIGSFLNCIKKGNTKITDEDKEILRKLGYVLEPKNIKKIIHEKVVLLIEFFEENGRPPKSTEEFKGVKIGSFLNCIKKGNTKTTDEDRERLEKIGYILEFKNIKENSHKKVKLLIEFFEENGRPPKDKEKYKGEGIGSFWGHVRRGETKISKEDREDLKRIGYQL